LANGYVTGRPPVNGFLQPMETRLSMPGDRDRRNSGMPYDPGMPAAEGRFPDRRLAHFLDEDSDQYVRRFALHLITISQPERGKVTAPLTCPTCGVPVTFTVHSPSGIRKLLGIWYLSGCVAAVLAVLVVVRIVVGWASGEAGPHGAPPFLAWLTGFSLLVIPFLVFAANELFRGGAAEDGLRIRKPPTGHSIRPDGADLEHVDYGDGTDPGGGE